jgi:hypothetical protein
VVFDDLYNTPLTKEWWSVFDDDNLRFEAQYSQKGNFFVQFTVNISLHAFYSWIKSILFVILKIFVDLKLLCKEVGLEFIEMRDTPRNVLF